MHSICITLERNDQVFGTFYRCLKRHNWGAFRGAPQGVFEAIRRKAHSHAAHVSAFEAQMKCTSHALFPPFTSVTYFVTKPEWDSEPIVKTWLANDMRG